jgi:N-acetylglucosaminyldiphosphoundecaprenol N-acetyl-beta-D-mannosaminyltransferase
MGGDPGAAEAAAEVLKSRYPGLQVAGTYCPPYGFDQDEPENRRAVEAVRSAEPDILFVGLGSPKQELWIARHMEELAIPVSIGVGISFSFTAGQVRRAPKWMRRVGLEWLHRLFSEPRRLWKRYLLRGPRFAPLVAREWIRTKRSR